MRRILLISLTACLVAPAAEGQQSAYCGWENGGTVLGMYGTGSPPIIATNVGPPDPVLCGLRSLCLEDNSPTDTPQAYVAWITGLTDGDIVEACFWRYDTTPGAAPSAPSCRIWAHYTTSDSIDDYQGSAGGNSDYGPGTGWDKTCWSWTFDSSGGTRDALVIECRTYSDPGDVVWIDNLEVTTTAGVIHLPDTGMRSVDLSVAEVSATCVDDSLLVGVTLGIGACGLSGGMQIEFSVDATMAGETYTKPPIVALPYPDESTCPEFAPVCDAGMCDTILVQLGGSWQPVIPECVLENYMGLSYCYCYSEYLMGFMIPLTPKGQREDILRVVVDEINDVEEWNEDNNEFTTSFTPTAVEHPTWGTLKQMYR